MKKQGSLPIRVMGYAMALQAWLCGDSRPDWVGHLRPDAATAFSEGLRYLERTADSLLRPDNLRRADADSITRLLDQLEQGPPSARVAALWELARRQTDADKAVPVIVRLHGGSAGRHPRRGRSHAGRTWPVNRRCSPAARSCFGRLRGRGPHNGRLCSRETAAAACACGGSADRSARRSFDARDRGLVVGAIRRGRSAGAAAPARPFEGRTWALLRGDRLPGVCRSAISPDPEAELRQLVESCDPDLRQQAEHLLPESGTIGIPPRRLGMVALGGWGDVTTSSAGGSQLRSRKRLTKRWNLHSRIVPALVRLPHLAALDVQRRQPAVAVTPGVDALEIAEVEDLAALLRGVADDGGLAGTVRAGLADFHRVPEKRLRRLGRKRQVGQIVAVNVEVPLRLVEQPAAAQELDVRRRECPRAAAMPYDSSVALPPNISQSTYNSRLAVVDLQHHFVVIAQQRDQAALPPELQQPLDRAAAVGAAVDVVAQRDDRVVRLRPDRRQQRLQRGQAAVDVADGNGARRRPRYAESSISHAFVMPTRSMRGTPKCHYNRPAWSLYNARQLDSAPDASVMAMIRRILCIGLMLSARLATLAGRLVGQEPAAGNPDPSPCPPWAENSSGPTNCSSTNGASSGTCSPDTAGCWTSTNLRHASGTYDECLAALEQIKHDRHLPPMKGKAVVVLHGLGRSRASMDSLCQYLREKGGYEVFNVEYPSTQYDMAEHARSLRHIIDNLHGIEEINFVGHSMGNIVIRHYLGDLARQDPTKQSPNAAAADRRAKARFGRFVMLAPPNQGALLADDVRRQRPVQGDRRRRGPATRPRLARTGKTARHARLSSSASSPAERETTRATTRCCRATTTA